MQIIFQDPYSSLNPRLTVEHIVGDALKTHGLASGEEVPDRVAGMLDKVGIHREKMRCFPHEFSGGQRQRIGIARALILQPKLIICDEPVSALDVSIQAQVINLLGDLKKEFQLSYILIAHDVSVVNHVSNRIAVMYLGKIIELASNKKLLSKPLHPYTQALMSAVPVLDPDKKKRRIILKGDVPSPVNPPSGCRFHPRCFKAMEVCSQVEPLWAEVEPEHFAMCHLYGSCQPR
jgi:peptide/nickel transport system ATP-binding protein/oligopeptide transport system ATP-binding protein